MIRDSCVAVAKFLLGTSNSPSNKLITVKQILPAEEGPLGPSDQLKITHEERTPGDPRMNQIIQICNIPGD